ncbi:MAG: RDD family protein [Candidatus Adiutrix sp.]|jgi:uncharacterized RDD family membrane protein YckC|nr:RDD family protein [Candidatus Adiutrix sp.]
MTSRADRLGEMLERGGRRRRTLVSPEGVPLDIQVAGHGERLTALLLDLLFMFAAILALWLILSAFLFSSRGASPLTLTLVMFLSFLIRNLYFLHFELAWRGRTPGKKVCRLRVINRRGGELTPSAVVARNLTREMEIFLPLTLFLLTTFEASWARLALLGWVAALASLPFWNRAHLRAGDLIAGTQVIAQPQRALLDDLSLQTQGPAEAPAAYSFSPEQLAIYGVLELQVLEEFLRRPPGPETDRLLAGVCRKILLKIGRRERVPQADIRRFLTDFYTAERTSLERGQLFGQLKADQKSAPEA